MKLNEVAEKMYFVFDYEWSQTDKDTVVIQAESRAEAEKKLKAKFPEGRGPKYISYVRTAKLVS